MYTWGLAGAVSMVLALAACGGQDAPSPGDIVQSYEAALAEGSNGVACGYLDPRTRAALARKVAPGATCAEALARCLPYKATVAKQDQSQLFYASVAVSEHGSHAVATLKGNPVANAIREVTLSNERKGWTLTSYGKGLTACHQRRHRGRRHGSRA